MKTDHYLQVTRRQFLGTAAALTAGTALGAPSLINAPAILRFYNRPDSVIKGVQIGVITYSFRSMADQSAEATLKYIKEAGLSATELMGDPAEAFAGKPENPVDMRRFFGLMRKQRGGETLTEAEQKDADTLRAHMEEYNKQVAMWRATASMKPFAQLKKMYKAAGIKIYAFKPNTFGKNNSDAEIEYGMRAAKTLGATHVTLEHPGDDGHTLKLAKLAEKHKIHVGYHGHEQQTPTLWDTALSQSKYNGMNLDVGHYVAAGNPDPLELLRARHDRILSMHVKDRQNPEHGKANLPWGEGDTPIGPVLQLMSTRKYNFPATIELEYDIPEGSDAVAEVQKCLEYCRKMLKG